MAGLTGAVKAVPALQKGKTVEIETRYGCQGMAGTSGWQLVRLIDGFRWTGSSQALLRTVNEDLDARGWARGRAPDWAGTTNTVDIANWVYPQGRPPIRALTLDPTGGTTWTAEVVAKPSGTLAKACLAQ
jgi:hypothetical protein